MANCRQWTLMTFFFVVEAIDLSCDWFFFKEIHNTDEKFATDNSYLKWVILTFGVLGTLTFIFEMINLGFEVFTSRGPCIFSDTVSMMTTWMEDVPQISLALAIAMKQNKVIHWIQYVKAAWAIVEIVFRGLGQCVYCCVISERHNKAINYCIAVFHFTAQVAILGCAIAIFVHIV